jgi:hypothetical protein
MKKRGKEKPGVTQLTRRVDPADPARPGDKPVDFCFFFVFVFFTKMTSF